MSEAVAELQRQATAAGVFLDFGHAVPCELREGALVAAEDSAVDEPTDDEAEQLLVWLRGWTAERERWEAERPERLAVQADAWLEQRRDLRVLPMLSRDRFELEQVAHMSAAGAGWDWKERAGIGWTERLPVARPLLSPPAGFELTRRSWCPRCDKIGGDPLGWWHDFGSMKGYLRRPRCAVFPPAPEIEIGACCPREYGEAVRWFPCGARRLYRWGLRRQVLKMVQSSHGSFSVFEELLERVNGDAARLLSPAPSTSFHPPTFARDFLRLVGGERYTHEYSCTIDGGVVHQFEFQGLTEEGAGMGVNFLSAHYPWCTWHYEAASTAYGPFETRSSRPPGGGSCSLHVTMPRRGEGASAL